MEKFEFEKGIIIEKQGYDKEMNFKIEDGTLFYNGTEYTEELFLNHTDKREFLTVLERTIEAYNKELEIIEEKKEKISTMQKNFNNLPNEWNKLKDLRTKEAFKLKDLTIKKLYSLKDELENNGKWNWARIGTVDFLNYGNESGYGDERTILMWSKEKGFYFATEEFSSKHKWIEKNNLSYATKFKKIEELNRTNIVMLAKTLPKRIKELTESYKDDISEIKNLIKSMG